MNPRVSILVAAWNAAKYISETILSVQSQSYEHWELIVVDDGSTDETADVLQSYALRDRRIKTYWQQNQGAHIARNLAFEKSTGEYIVILDADDCILPKKLKIQVDLLDSHSEYGVVYGDTWHCDEFMNRQLLESKKYPGQHVHGDIFEKMLVGNRFAVHAGMVRRTVVSDVGLHSVNALLIADWDFWVRVAEKYKFFYDSQPVAEYRIHPGMSARIDASRKQLDQRMGTVRNIEKLERFNSTSIRAKEEFNFANIRFAQKFGLHREALSMAKRVVFIQPFNFKVYMLFGLSIVQILIGKK